MEEDITIKLEEREVLEGGDEGIESKNTDSLQTEVLQENFNAELEAVFGCAHPDLYDQLKLLKGMRGENFIQGVQEVLDRLEEEEENLIAGMIMLSGINARISTMLSNFTNGELIEIVDCNGNYNLRNLAYIELAERSGDEVYRAALKALQSDNYIIRIRGVELLGKMKTKESDLLLKAFDDEDDSVRMTVIESLWNFEDNRSLEVLFRGLTDSSEDVVEVAFEVIEKLDPNKQLQLLELISDDEKIRFRLLKTLNKSDKFTTEINKSPLAAQLYDELRDLAQANEQKPIDPLVLIQDESDEIKEKGYRLLLEQRISVPIKFLIPGLESDFWACRERAALLLVKSGDEGISVLKDYAVNGGNYDVKSSAIMALGGIEDPSVEALLLEILQKDSNIYLRLNAALALAELTGLGYEGVIMELIEDLEINTLDRSSAFETLTILAKEGSIRAVSILAQFLENDREIFMVKEVLDTMSKCNNDQANEVIANAAQDNSRPYGQRKALSILKQKEEYRFAKESVKMIFSQGSNSYLRIESLNSLLKVKMEYETCIMFLEGVNNAFTSDDPKSTEEITLVNNICRKILAEAGNQDLPISQLQKILDKAESLKNIETLEISQALSSFRQYVGGIADSLTNFQNNLERELF